MPDELIEMQRIADHRSLYLDYEGPISGDRGVVRRLDRGTIERGEAGDDAWMLEIVWRGPSGDEPPRRQRLRVEQRDESRWIVFAF
jgi:hypothetical protein